VHLYTRQEFEKAISEKKEDDEYTLVKFADTTIKAVEGDENSLEFIVSDGSVDADRDTLSPDGWDLKRFKKNPVVLFGHSHYSLPIARATKTWIDGGQLRSIAKFPTAEEVTEEGAKFPQTVLQMYKSGYLNSVSVGFMPKDWTYNEDRQGYDFVKQEMLEFSAVPVPSNPNALVQARSAGIDLGPLKGWVMKLLDESTGLFVRADLEGMYKEVNDTPQIAVPATKSEEPESDDVADDQETQKAEVDTDTEKRLSELESANAKLLDVTDSINAKLEMILTTKSDEPDTDEPEPQEPESVEATDADYAALRKTMQDEMRLKLTGALPD